MTWIALFFTCSSVLFLIWTLINSSFLPKLQEYRSVRYDSLVSVLIPMRNEERNVVPLILSLKKLTYSNLEFIILNDGSTDQTLPLLSQYTSDDTRFSIIQGQPLRSNWVGKVNACDQLGQRANGRYLLFIDADVRLQPNTVQAALYTMEKTKASLLTGFPKFPTTTLLSRLLVPMQHFVVLFHLPISIANSTFKSSTTAAHGAFMLFRRSTYDRIGGHASVYNSLVEDVHISRVVKKNKEKVVLANITAYVTCFMYESNGEVWNGFKKNLFTGLGRSVPFAIGLALFYVFFYVIPFLLIFQWNAVGMFALLPILFLYIQRYWIDRKMNQEKGIFLLLPLSILAFISLIFASMRTALQNKQYEWKGRFYS